MADFPSSPPFDVESSLETINRRQFDHGADGTLRGIDLGRGANPPFNLKLIYRYISTADYETLYALIEANLGDPMGVNFHDGESYTGYVQQWAIERHSAGLWSLSIDFIGVRNP